MFDLFLTVKQILRKLGGDKNPGKVITFDGNLSGKETFEIEPGMFLVKLSDDVYDINNVESITISDFDGEKTLQKDAFTIVYDGSLPAIALGETPCVTVIPEDGHEGLPIGLFVFYMTENGFSVYPSKIQLAETIVPIDQKYLPGVCLPVVELETAVTSTQAALSEEDGAQMDALNGEPAVLKLVAIVNGAEWALRGIAACTNVDGILVYSITSYVESTLLVLLMNAGNGWVAVCNYG